MSAKGGRNRADTDLKKDEEKESVIDSDEYQDMVFDIEYGRSLIQKADDFLDNKPSQILSDTSSINNQSKVSFVNSNKD